MFRVVVGAKVVLRAVPAAQPSSRGRPESLAWWRTPGRRPPHRPPGGRRLGPLRTPCALMDPSASKTGCTSTVPSDSAVAWGGVSSALKRCTPKLPRFDTVPVPPPSRSGRPCPRLDGCGEVFDRRVQGTMPRSCGSRSTGASRPLGVSSPAPHRCGCWCARRRRSAPVERGLAQHQGVGAQQDGVQTHALEALRATARRGQVERPPHGELRMSAVASSTRAVAT